MNRRPSPKCHMAGFTLIELLIVITILTILASMMIPNFLRLLDAAKQKRTMAEMHLTGKAMMSWMTDNVGAAAAGAQTTQVDMADFGPSIPLEVMESYLEPLYMAEVPTYDGWTNPFEYRFKVDFITEPRAMAIRSAGQGGTFDSDVYTSGPFDPTDYAQDIVWGDGYFVRWADRVN